jgi:hypothetical protein
MKFRLAGLGIFVLFFGLATVDAIATHSWMRSIFWLAIGAAFFGLDNLRKPVQTK